MTALGITSWFPLVQLPLNEVTWTISTLMSFYLVFPYLAPRLQRSVQAGNERVAAMCLYVVQLIWPSLLGWWVEILWVNICHHWYSSNGIKLTVRDVTGQGIALWFARAFPPCRLPVFIMGCLAGKYVTMLQKNMPKNEFEFCCRDRFSCCQGLCQRWGCSFADQALVGYFVAILCFIPHEGYRDYLVPIYNVEHLEHMLAMLYFDWIVCLCTRNSAVSYFLASTPMRFLGRISMPLYMVHMLVFHLFETNFNGAWIVVSSLCTSLVIAYVLHRFVEKPAQECIIRLCLSTSVSASPLVDSLKPENAASSIHVIRIPDAHLPAGHDDTDDGENFSSQGISTANVRIVALDPESSVGLSRIDTDHNAQVRGSLAYTLS